jgi:hypothetical protein
MGDLHNQIERGRRGIMARTMNSRLDNALVIWREGVVSILEIENDWEVAVDLLLFFVEKLSLGDDLTGGGAEVGYVGRKDRGRPERSDQARSTGLFLRVSSFSRRSRCT